MQELRGLERPWPTVPCQSYVVIHHNEPVPATDQLALPQHGLMDGSLFLAHLASGILHQ